MHCRLCLIMAAGTFGFVRLQKGRRGGEKKKWPVSFQEKIHNVQDLQFALPAPREGFVRNSGGTETKRLMRGCHTLKKKKKRFFCKCFVCVCVCVCAHVRDEQSNSKIFTTKTNVFCIVLKLQTLSEIALLFLLCICRHVTV